MPRVTGIGGIFFRASDPERTKAWYEEHLGIPAGEYGWMFGWRDHDQPEREGLTVWNPFERGTDYFGTDQEHMINYRVDDLDGLVAELAKAGIPLDKPVEEMEGIGRFAWVRDPDGRRIELWEPA